MSLNLSHNVYVEERAMLLLSDLSGLMMQSEIVQRGSVHIARRRHLPMKDVLPISPHLLPVPRLVRARSGI